MGVPLLGYLQSQLAAAVGVHPIFLAMAALLVLVVYGFHPIKRWRYRHIPGPPTRWLVGVLPELVQGTVACYPAWAAKYAPHGVFKTFMGAIPHVVVTDPVLSRRVIMMTGHKFTQPFVRVTALDEDLLASNFALLAMGPEWKEQRSVWSPFFSLERMESYLPGMLRSSGRLKGVLDRAATAGTSIDLYPTMGSLALEVVATTAAGIPYEMLAADGGGGALIPGTCLTEKLMWSIRAIMKSVVASSLMTLLYMFPGSDAVVTALARITRPAKDLDRRRALEFVASTYGKMILDYRSGESVFSPDSFVASVATWRDKESGELKPLAWAIMMLNFLVTSGEDTTSAALAHIFYFVSLNKDKEAAVLAEVDAFGRDREPKSMADLQELPYLKAVVWEALRLMPSAPVAIRQAETDMQLGPYTVPAGTWLHALIWDMQRSGDHWDEPEEFRPERFLGEKKGGKDAFMPFGEGARRCPGYRLAMQEGVLALLRVYQRFTFELEPGQDPLVVRSLVTLSPIRGVWARVVRREEP